MVKRLSTNNTECDAIFELLNQFGKFGAAASCGVSRLAASEADKQARDHLCDWLNEHGLKVIVDGVGNIFGVLDLEQGDADKHFFCGSHLDSQPHGGIYDGALGVVCACILALKVKQAVNEGILASAYRYFVVVSWTAEEGARFQPSLLGSSVFTGELSVEDALASKDHDGISLKKSLIDIGYLGKEKAPWPNYYLELHIEQGIRLESSKKSVGIVTSCWGAKKFRIVVYGQPDHTGPTPMKDRRDALLTAARIIMKVNQISDTSATTLHTSVGRIEVAPNSPNTVADCVHLWAEFRCGDKNALIEAQNRITEEIDSLTSQTGCKIEIASREQRNVVEFDKTGIELIGNTLERAKISYLKLPTIAGHDAIRLQAICPSTLLFVPSKNGISHSPDEFTSNEDICTGFDAMVHAAFSCVSNPTQEQ